MGFLKVNLMEKSDTPRRAYRSRLRADQAASTRRRILECARKLFLENGYPTTSIAGIARAAEVSADTVYATFGTKLAILKAVFDEGVVGDQADVPLLARPGPQSTRQLTDQRGQVASLAQGVVEILERVAPLDEVLRGAAAVDPDAAELRRDIQLNQRRKAMRQTVRWLAANGPLRDGLSEQDAATVLWTLTSPEVYRLLRVDSGWSRKRYQNWLEGALIHGLLRTSGG
jgi:AcrR family transcriptional regulator